MKVRRKVISVLELSPIEMGRLVEMLQEAKEGHKVHYAETQTGPNTFFGISISQQHEADSPIR